MHLLELQENHRMWDILMKNLEIYGAQDLQECLSEIYCLSVAESIKFYQ